MLLAAIEFDVLTWNVLHRVHAINWEEPAILRWKDEHARMSSIAAWLAAEAPAVICLQEVSGDQLAILREVLRGEVHSFAYPRLPAYRRRTEATTLRDATEYLVTIVREGGARVSSAAAFPSDPGKGHLAVELKDGTRIINAHVTYGDKRDAQCAALIAAAEGATRVVLCGDFNADRNVSSARLGDTLSCAALRDTGVHTRPRQTESEKSQDIDHVFVRGLAVVDAASVDAEGRSDHNPVRVRLAAAPDTSG